MSKSFHFMLTAAIALMLSIVTVHYFEVPMLPLVESARIAIYGDQSYSSALQGCQSLDPEEDWVHPSALALTVYGESQAALADAYGAHEYEVMPDYARSRPGAGELICVANYLVAVSERRSIGGSAVRAFPFDIPQKTYDLPGGWISGLTQGVVGQVLLGAYLVDGDEKYLLAAREAGRLLAVDIEDGGVRYEMRRGSAWYEEYALAGYEPPLVLNGHLLALDFLYWMNKVDNDSDWGTLFDSGLQAAADHIGRYQSFAWSYYDRKGHLATGKYHAFHVRQLSRYAAHDQSGALAQARKNMRWQMYVPLGVFQRLIRQPSKLLLFLTGLFFAVYFPIVWFAAYSLSPGRAGGA